MTDHKIVQAIESFATTYNGVPVMVLRGQLWNSADPVVRGNPAAFGDAEVRSSDHLTSRQPISSGSVETASAEPGGKRRLSRKPLDTEVREAEVSTPSEV
jgi:hypothetical protein